jgi:hypothetical protein
MGDQEKIQSSILKLETLKTQFTLAMQQYKTAFANYTISTTSENLRKVNSLNDLLSNLHSQILDTLKYVNPTYYSVSDKTKIQVNNLNAININLLKERQKINKLLSEYNTLDHLQTDTTLKIESQYTYYKILLIISLVLMFFIVYQFLYSSSSSNYLVTGGRNTLFYKE